MARIIPGIEKITWIPWSASQPPNQPGAAVDQVSAPARSRPARPRTAGRSGAFSSALPRNRRRTSTSAASTPKTVLSGTATATISSVSQNACRASGLVTASQAGAEPVLEGPVEDEPDRQREQEQRGSRARSVRRPRRTGGYHAWRRPQRETPRVMPEQHEQSITSRSTTDTAAAPAHAVALDLAEDEDGRDLGLERQVARDQHHRAELTERARERQRRRRRGSRGTRLGRMMRRKIVNGAAPSEAAASSASRSSSDQHRLHGAHDERQRHEQQRQRPRRRACRRRSRRAGCAGRRAPAGSGPATMVGSANGRSISELTKPLPAEVVAHEHPGDHRADHGVDRGHDERHDERQLERRPCLRVR